MRFPCVLLYNIIQDNLHAFLPRSLPPPPALHARLSPSLARYLKVIANYTKKLAATDPDTNPIRGPLQPPSWELPEGSDYPDVSDDESEGEEVNTGDKAVSLIETRKEMEERMEKKVRFRKTEACPCCVPRRLLLLLR